MTESPDGPGSAAPPGKWTMKCTKCGADLGGFDNEEASICLRPREDEETRSYFLCEACGVYSAWICIEDFWTDEDTMFPAGPISREEGDEIVEKIRKCPNSDNASCKCPSHKEMSRWILTRSKPQERNASMR